MAGLESTCMPVTSKAGTQRLRITLRGAVQGVGFRPFVYRLTTEMSLTGWVLNSSSGLVVEVEGAPDELRHFEQRLETERPKASVVTARESEWLPSQGFTRFEIHHSEADSAKSVNVLPDLATCADCRNELFDPTNRRHQYPFTNCTNCGPRYTIVVDIPDDRPFSCAAECLFRVRAETGRHDCRCWRCAGPRRNSCIKGNRRISTSGGRAPAGGRRSAAAAQASRREAVCANDAIARSRAGVLRDRGRRAGIARVASCADCLDAPQARHRYCLECRALLALYGCDAAVLAAASYAHARVPVPDHCHQREPQRRANRDSQRRSSNSTERDRRSFPDAQPADRASLR